MNNDININNNQLTNDKDMQNENIIASNQPSNNVLPANNVVNQTSSNNIGIDNQINDNLQNIQNVNLNVNNQNYVSNSNNEIIQQTINNDIQQLNSNLNVDQNINNQSFDYMNNNQVINSNLNVNNQNYVGNSNNEIIQQTINNDIQQLNSNLNVDQNINNQSFDYMNNNQMINSNLNVNNQNYVINSNNEIIQQTINNDIQQLNSNLNVDQNINNQPVDYMNNNQVINSNLNGNNLENGLAVDSINSSNTIVSNNMQMSYNDTITNNTISSISNDVYQTNNSIQTKYIVKLILSILNVLIIVPFVARFGLLWSLFGAFGNSTTYVVLLGACAIYLILSVIFLIRSIWNVVKYNKVLKRIYLAILVLIPICLIIAFYSGVNSVKTIKKENNLKENTIIYSDNDISIKQKQIKYELARIKVYFEMNSQNPDNYTIKNGIVRINNAIINNCKIINDENNLYYISILESDLRDYKISEIKKIDFQMYDKINKKYTDINFVVNANGDYDVINSLGLDNEKYLLYSNDYFKMYFSPYYTSVHANIIIKSNIDDEYRLHISNADFDTQGYVNEFIEHIQLYKHSTNVINLSYSVCRENLGYIKFDYEILDENYDTIKKDKVDLKFNENKITTKYCNDKN